ncbi:hypothetical protein CDAR_542861 [Caerostris darwini]|uniref:Uncharacterized protein n=1 Tax=Caerostris darwini TaxID=1538125 RepID=A0AAV4SF78_9ARAC|nr:hypothetical protein CDAR_542861 [Caerostris darwini]
MGLEEKLRQSFPASKSLKLWSVFRKGDGPVTGRFMAPFKALDLGRYQTKFTSNTLKPLQVSEITPEFPSAQVSITATLMTLQKASKTAESVIFEHLKQLTTSIKFYEQQPLIIALNMPYFIILTTHAFNGVSGETSSEVSRQQISQVMVRLQNGG